MDLPYIKNFVIISHIDHGKSTLADRFLELTNTVSREKLQPQYLDSMPLEREKGITIKMHPCRMTYQIDGTKYILNLIDTPGHIDFSYEISRALACVEGAILLVDASQGIQAQTLFNLEEAKKQNLKIIGVVNKIDLLNAEVSQTKKELAAILNTKEEEIFTISAKKGTNVEKLLSAAIEKIPSPTHSMSSQAMLASQNFRALIFDSKYDSFSGVVAFVRVFDGMIKKGDKICLMAQQVESEVKEVGIFSPEPKPCLALAAGEIGYIKTGIKVPAKVRVGDTVVKISDNRPQISKIESLPGYKNPKPVLFLSLYPENPDEFETLKISLEKLKLNDPSLESQLESKMALGRGLRIGFLGSLHAEITVRRLKGEFGLDLILTSPQVIFKVLTNDNKELFVSSPSLWPDPSQIKEMQEPWAELELITPDPYSNQVFKILKNFKAELKETKLFGFQKSLIRAQIPLRGIISGNFYDKLKGSTSGFASFSFRQIGFQKADLVKIDILIASRIEEPFSQIVSREDSEQIGRKILEKLKWVLPPQQFAVSLQAAIGGKIIARETIRAQRKDVTASLYGGDVTRKNKLLAGQKKGKEKLKERGKINIPAKVFLELLKAD